MTKNTSGIKYKVLIQALLQSSVEPFQGLNETVTIELSTGVALRATEGRGTVGADPDDYRDFRQNRFIDHMEPNLDETE